MVFGCWIGFDFDRLVVLTASVYEGQTWKFVVWAPPQLQLVGLVSIVLEHFFVVLFPGHLAQRG